jgi:hypothetical protein
VAREIGNAGETRAYPEREILVILPLQPLGQSTLGVGRCGNIFFGHVRVAVRKGLRRDAVATEKNNSVDVQQGRVNISGFICTVAS